MKNKRAQKNQVPVLMSLATLASMSLTLLTPMTVFALVGLPTPAVVSCTVFQDGKDVNSINSKNEANRKGGSLTWTATVKYSQKYVSEYINDAPKFTNNFKDFSWTATIDGKTINLVPLSNNPNLSNFTTNTVGDFTYITNSFKISGDFAGLPNTDFKDVFTKVSLNTEVSGIKTADCNVHFASPELEPLSQIKNAVITKDATPTTPATTTSSSTEKTAEDKPKLLPSPDIISCKANAKVLYFENNEPAYDLMTVNCALKKTAIITANIYNKSYDPKSEDNSANLVYSVLDSTSKKPGGIRLNWKGYDNYDQTSPLDEYNFVIEAKLDSKYSPDISIQKFKTDNVPSALGEVATNPTSTENQPNISNESTPNSSAENLHGSAVEETIGSSIATPPKEATTTPANSNASKCPGVNYPTDIESSPVKNLILQAYDLCLIQGYSDGTFGGKQNITRAEATKIAVLAAGKIAKVGCYDNDCGSPFNDLDMWQGPWVRAAWELKLTSGVSPSQFAPNRFITKAESASLIVKALKIPPHSACYNASCGAGFPNDIFLDIVQTWQGPYLRALWDKGAIQSVEPHKFMPETAITREQFVETLMKAKK